MINKRFLPIVQLFSLKYFLKISAGIYKVKKVPKKEIILIPKVYSKIIVSNS
jgi:hypothetical protein